VNGGSDPRVLPTGQLVYIHDGTLLAVPFDNKRLTVKGGPVPIVEGVTETGNTWAGQFAISSEGTLAFKPGTMAAAAPPSTLIWVDRQGHEQPISAKPRAYAYPRLSPDGTKIAVGSTDEENDIWVFDIVKETLTRLTFGPAFELHPAWTLDNKDVLFSSNPSANLAAAPTDIFRKAADGTGATEALTHGPGGGFPMGVSPDGKSLVFRRYNGNPGLYVLPLEPKGEAHALIADSKFSIMNAQISPDGRWIAYDSNESGRYEVYVRPFPAVDTGRWQISAEGGSRPLWARSGREIFFLNAANRMMAVPVPAGPSFTYGKPEALFDFTPYVSATVTGRMFDISPDGKRFLTAKPVGSVGAAHPSIVVVSHWFDEVKARMPRQ
jgi:serine/threonine-protein kinase